MANFYLFLAKTVEIIKKALGTFFSRLQALTNCKVSENKHAMLGLSTNLNLIYFFGFQEDLGLEGIKILPNNFKIANV